MRLAVIAALWCFFALFPLLLLFSSLTAFAKRSGRLQSSTDIPGRSCESWQSSRLWQCQWSCQLCSSTLYLWIHQSFEFSHLMTRKAVYGYAISLSESYHEMMLFHSARPGWVRPGDNWQLNLLPWKSVCSFSTLVALVG